MNRRRDPRQFSEIKLLEIRMLFDLHEPELPPSLWEAKPVIVTFRLIPWEQRIEGDDDYWPVIFSPGDETALDWWLFMPPSTVSGVVTNMNGRWIARNKAAREWLRWRKAYGYSGGENNFLLGGRRIE